MSDYQSGDPPTDRGPIIGVPQDDLNRLRARIRELEAKVAALREGQKIPAREMYAPWTPIREGCSTALADKEDT